MALGKSVDEHLEQAESSLRAALSFAARGERPNVCAGLSDLLVRITALKEMDRLVDTFEQQTKDLTGDGEGPGGFPFFK